MRYAGMQPVPGIIVKEFKLLRKCRTYDRIEVVFQRLIDKKPTVLNDNQLQSSSYENRYNTDGVHRPGVLND